MEPVSAVGTLKVYGEQVFFDAYRFSPINLTFVAGSFDYDSECGPCTVYVNMTSYTPVSGGSYCEVAIPPMEAGRHNSTISCLGHDFNLSVKDARILWDRPEVLGRFWVDRLGIIFVSSPSVVMSHVYFNETGHIYDNGSIRSIVGEDDVSEIFYYSGDLYNNGTTTELVN